MEQVRIDLTNCYGIKALTATFDFWPLRCRVFSSMDCSCCLLFGLDSIDFGFETVACIEDYDSACRNHDLLACLWISSRAGVLTSHAELAKVGDRDGFSLLQGRLEECKKPIQQRRRFFFRDPGFLMNAVGNLHLLHLVSFPLR
jgi:hypothetical protein